LTNEKRKEEIKRERIKRIKKLKNKLNYNTFNAVKKMKTKTNIVFTIVIYLRLWISSYNLSIKLNDSKKKKRKENCVKTFKSQNILKKKLTKPYKHIK